jgi:WD40 repeat protein/biotin carboxyl carrier protein
MRRVLVAAAVSALTVAVIIWRAKGGSDRARGEDELPPWPAATPSREVLEAPPDDAPPLLAGGPLHDPVVVGPCNLFPHGELEVSSPIEGVLEEVAVDLGRPVAAGDVLARLDDGQVRPQVELLRIRAASTSAERIAQALLDDADDKLRIAERANLISPNAVSRAEYQGHLRQKERFTQEVLKAREDRAAAERELERARKLLELHKVRSTLTGEVVKVYKRSGEVVKQAEPLFRVAGYDRLRAEGLCKASQAHLLRVGMRAAVEPELRGEPLAQLRGHTGPVNDLAVAPDGRLLASAGDDGVVILWRWPDGARLADLPHPGEVYAVAFDPSPALPQKLITGGADGRPRVWRVTERGRAGEPTVLAREHEGPIRAIAVSHDGRRFVTGGDDRRVVVWDVESGAPLYRVAAVDENSAHHGAITALRLTADGCLVSWGRDNTAKVWRLGDGGARLLRNLPGRTGDVTRPDVSPDGRVLAFDHGDEVRLLDRDRGTPLGALQGRKHGHFRGPVCFSPSGRLLLTSSSGGLLQLWQAPAPPEGAKFLRGAFAHGFDRAALAQLLPPGPADIAPVLLHEAGGQLPRLWPLDAYEVRQFPAPGAGAACAVFAPDESVLFTAGDEVVRVWPVPAASQWRRPLEARITFVGSQLERGTDMVRVRAEFDNPTDPASRLRAGIFVNLRVYPETGTTPSGPPAARPVPPRRQQDDGDRPVARANKGRDFDVLGDTARERSTRSGQLLARLDDKAGVRVTTLQTEPKAQPATAEAKIQLGRANWAQVLKEAEACRAVESELASLAADAPGRAAVEARCRAARSRYAEWLGKAAAEFQAAEEQLVALYAAGRTLTPKERDLERRAALAAANCAFYAADYAACVSRYQTIAERFPGSITELEALRSVWVCHQHHFHDSAAAVRALAALELALTRTPESAFISSGQSRREWQSWFDRTAAETGGPR